MSMSIGAFVSLYGMGGAQNSSITICNALAERGHQVTLYCPASNLFSHVRPKVELYDWPLNTLDLAHFLDVSGSNYRRALREIRRRRHDVLLSFTYPSLFMVIPIVLSRGIRCVQYMLGPVVSSVLAVHPGTIVANSEETRDILARALHRPAERIPVVRARVNARLLRDRADRSGKDNPFAPPPGTLQVAMMSTWHPSKFASIRQALQAVSILSARRSDFRFLLAGEGTLRGQVEAAIADVNRHAGREVAIATGYVGDVGAFLSAADVAMGVGRCAFEAMALGRTTLVLGSLGYAGTVCPEEADALAYYNFAGRNIRAPSPPDVLADRLNALLDDADLRARCGRFAREYLHQHLDVDIGAAQFEQILLREMSLPSIRPLRRARAWAGYTACAAWWTGLGLGKWALRPYRTTRELAKIRRTRASGPQYCYTYGGGTEGSCR